MSNPVYAAAQGAQAKDGTIATAKVSSNTTVTTSTGPIGLLSDVINFPGPTVVGNWVTASTRVTVRGVPIITTASQGVCFTGSTPPVPTSPMTIISPDSRVQAQ